MIEEVIYTSKADDDVAAAYAWYENRTSGLGEEFLRCLGDRVLTLQQHPRLYPVAVGEFRRAVIRRFPFEIFYEPGAKTLTIYAVFHCSQDPQKWRSRLPSDG